MADRALDKIMEDLPTSPVSPVRSASPASPLVMDGIPVFMGDLQDLFDSLPPLTPDPTDASAFDLDGFVSPDVRPSPSPSPKPPSSPTISPQEMEKVVSLDEWRPGQGMIIRPIPLSEIKQWPRVEIRQYYETMNRVQNKYGHESELEGLFKPTVEEIGKLLHWDAPKTNNEIRAMGRDELLDHLNELKEINTQEYSKTGERKINYKIGLVEERLKELSEEKSVEKDLHRLFHHHYHLQVHFRVHLRVQVVSEMDLQMVPLLVMVRVMEMVMEMVMTTTTTTTTTTTNVTRMLIKILLVKL